MKIDWKRKLSSRKFWALIAGLISGIVIYINSPEKSPEKLASIITIACSVAAYILGEGIADSKNDTVQCLPVIESFENESEETENG